MDSRDGKTLERLREDLRAMHGDALRSILLVGEAAGPDYRPRRSPLAIVVVVDDVTPDLLRRMRGHIHRWKRRRIDTPLVLDPLYIETAMDVFPIELLDIADRHELLWGTNPFADFDADFSHLRLEVEEQLRGKMLHLWECYLSAGRSRRRLRQILVETPSGFGPVLRGLLRLRDAPRPVESAALLGAVEAAFDVSLPIMNRLAQGHERRNRTETEQVFASYLAEVRSLVRLVDTL